MSAFVFTTAILMSTVASQEKSCELRDIKTFSVQLATTRNHLETMIEEKKKPIMEEVKQTKYKTKQQAIEIKTLQVNSLETATRIEDMFKKLTVLIKKEDIETKERLGEIKQNVTGVRKDVNSLLNITDGGWSLWSNWSECPATCLGGLIRRTRTCNNPEPSIFGQDCVGNDEEVDICNSFMCPDINDCIGHSCKNGATCVDGVYTYTCKCAAGFTEEQCETGLSHDCREARDNGNIRSGIYDILLWKSMQTTAVYCDMTTDGGGWTVFQNRFNGSVDFYKSFSEYENGFGTLEGEFWLGLKYIQEMTDPSNGSSELRLDLSAADGSTAYEVFQNFYLSGGNNYTLNIGPGTGTAGDANGLSYNRGYRFTTYDRDMSIGNCANVDRGGWWYYNCAFANLNGEYITPGTESLYNNGEGGMTYRDFKDFESLKTSKMMFRHTR